MIQILSSPILWSSAIALLGVVLGLKLYIEKIKRQDEAIKDQRKEQYSLKNQNVE